jgi:hypothetical protein
MSENVLLAMKTGTPRLLLFRCCLREIIAKDIKEINDSESEGNKISFIIK